MAIPQPDPDRTYTVQGMSCAHCAVSVGYEVVS